MPTERILIVEDDDSIRRAMVTVLGRAGYRVREASSGQEATRMWKEEECDLVLTDIHMPDKDGIEMMRELRELKPELPIIAVSGSGERTCRALLSGANINGAIRTLDKPFKIAELLDCVGQLLESVAPRGSRRTE
jgi:CheY-like chemotaxis protein